MWVTDKHILKTTSDLVRIGVLNAMYNKFIVADLFAKVRNIFSMYAALDTEDKHFATWYPRFEQQLDKKLRPTTIVQTTDAKNNVDVNDNDTLSLRSLIIAFGPKCVPLVTFAKQHNLTEDARFVVLKGDIVSNDRTAQVISVDHPSTCPLAHIPMKAIGIAVAVENGIVELKGFGDVRFNDPKHTNMLDYACYAYQIK